MKQKLIYACLKIGEYLLSFCKGKEKNMFMDSASVVLKRHWPFS